jgi:hypothetical protein
LSRYLKSDGPFGTVVAGFEPNACNFSIEVKGSARRTHELQRAPVAF